MVHNAGQVIIDRDNRISPHEKVNAGIVAGHVWGNSEIVAQLNVKCSYWR
jgi:hypothetical protein